MGQVQKIPLTQGMYESRSIIANAQRCVNLYPEANAEDAPFPYTFYPTPGLKTQFTPSAAGPSRGQFTASNGNLYWVIGRYVWYIAPNFVGTVLGILTTVSGPVSIADNGTTAIIVDGTLFAYTIDLATNAMALYADPNFLGADSVCFLDGYLVFNLPGTRTFYTTLNYSTTIDPTYQAARVGASDPIKGVAAVSRQLYLLGTKTSEVWANAASGVFPFEAVQGGFIRHGVPTIFSMAPYDQGIFVAAQNPEGKGMVLLISGYGMKRVSTPAIESMISQLSTESDAVGFTYMQAGHVFYVLNFPTGDLTVVYDLMNDRWHTRSWLDSEGVEHRWRANGHAFAYDTNLVGDWENGKIYSLELEQYNDFGGPILRRKSFPHMVNSGRQMIFEQFQAEMAVGEAGMGDAAALVSMRYSNTRGRSWSNPELRSLGASGDYALVPQWRGQGMARDMVYELSWSSDVKTALNGAYCFVTPTDA